MAGLPGHAVAVRGVRRRCRCQRRSRSRSRPLASRSRPGRRGVLRGDGGLLPGELSREPDLVHMDAPGHGYDAAGNARGTQAEQTRDDRLTDVGRRERGCEHGTPR